MRILFVSRIDPLPPEGGEQIRAWHFVTGLGAKHHVDVVSFADPEASPARVETAKHEFGRWIREDLPPDRPLRARLLAYPRLIPTFHVNHHSPRFVAAVEQMLDTTDYDVIHVFGLPLAQYVPVALTSGTPVVLDVMDSWGLLYGRYAAATDTKSSRIGWKIRQWVNARYERRATALGVPIVVTSDADRQAVLALSAKPVGVTTIPNGVDAQNHFRPPSSASTRPDHLVFVGDMSYRANVRGVSWFIDEVLPLVALAKPQTHLTIVGKNPVAEIQDRAGPAVTVTGFVEDVRPFINEAEVVVVPLLSGTGIKNKVIEAMALQKPVVMSELAGEGIAFREHREGFTAATPAEFADAIVRLLDDSKLRERVGIAARSFVLANYDWSIAISRLEEVYRQARFT